MIVDKIILINDDIIRIIFFNLLASHIVFHFYLPKTVPTGYFQERGPAFSSLPYNPQTQKRTSAGFLKGHPFTYPTHILYISKYVRI